jgi:hypothetical protein
MHAALSPVLEIGPAFLAGGLNADAMATTMVRAVREYSDGGRGRQHAGARPDDEGAPTGTSIEALHAALAEIYTCGSGYLAGRCEADCVARTMAQIMREFGDLAPAR